MYICKHEVELDIQQDFGTSKKEWLYQVKIRQAVEICVLEEAFSNSCWEQMQLQPPSILAIAWARPKSTAATNPNMKAWWLGSLHSNIHTLKCFTCLLKTTMGG